MWVRTQLKIDWRDLAAGAWMGLRPPERAKVLAQAESYFSTPADTIATYSVRSGFDLLIQSLGLEPGDEVIFTALNVRGMVKAVKDAGLVPVPVDLDMGTMAPGLDTLKAVITPRSKLFVAAHLFGTRLDLADHFALARRHGIIAVEDCAQAFNGKAYAGSPEADVAMFSFGPIKTATALGGALLRVRDPALLARMRALQATYPMQKDSQHLARVRQFMGLKFITNPGVLAAIFKWQDWQARKKQPSAVASPDPAATAPATASVAPDATVGGAENNDSPAPPPAVVYEDKLADRVRDVAPLKTRDGLRVQPSAAMLGLMVRRLSRFGENSLQERKRKGEFLRDQINGAVVIPGQVGKHHDYWVFPLLVSEPRAFITALRKEGFDASDLPRSQHVAAPKDRKHFEPVLSAKVMKDLIVVPCYDDIPDSELVRMAAVIRKVAATVPARTEL